MDEAPDKVGVVIAECKSRPDNQASDEALAAAVCLGDDRAFEEIFVRHRWRVVRITARFFNRPERVEEIVQETFAKVYFGIGNYSHKRGSSFVAWVSRIAINCCYDELRRMKRRPETPIGGFTEDEATFLNARSRSYSRSGNAESELVSRDLAMKLLARLSPKDRLVLTLLEADEMPVAEIAEALGWSISKVKVRAHRARTALRRALKDLL